MDTGRINLADKIGQRHSYTATIQGWGSRPGRRKTILLINVMCDDQEVADHLWVGYSRAFLRVEPLAIGDQITFTAAVKSYWKGYRGKQQQRWQDAPIRRLTYSLHRIHQVKKCLKNS